MSFHKTDINDDRFIPMDARFNSKCRECEEDILEGDPIIYDTKEKKAYCVPCGKELQ